MEIVKDLVKNYESSIKLENTLKKINNQIRKQSNPYIKFNLQAWARKYRYRIKRIEKAKVFNKLSSKIGNSKKYFSISGVIKEKYIEDYIYKNGLKFNDIEINKFESQKTIGNVGAIVGTVDLFGITDKQKYIIEVKSYSARANVLGQVIGYWQYFKVKDNKNYSIIIIAPSYSKQYKLALGFIRDNTNLEVISIYYKFKDNKMKFNIR